MQSTHRLSAFAAVLAAASLVLVSSAAQAYPRNYKGEMNYKGEYQSVPTEPASSCCSDKILMPGFYLGASAGYDVYKFRQNTTADAGAGIVVSGNPAVNAKGWNGMLFAGYGINYAWFYLGLEVMANDSNADSNYQLSVTEAGVLDTYNVKVKSRYSYGAGLLPGVRLNDGALLYGRVGYDGTSFRVTESGNTAAGSIHASNDKWGNGFNYGLGIEAAVARNVSLRAEYTYTSYNNITSSRFTRFTPSNNQFEFGVIYHFV